MDNEERHVDVDGVAMTQWNDWRQLKCRRQAVAKRDDAVEPNLVQVRRLELTKASDYSTPLVVEQK